MFAGVGAVGRVGRPGLAGAGAHRATFDQSFLGGTLGSGAVFTRASAGWYYNSSGVLVQAGVDVPRFDYDPVTLQLKGLLLEDASTNTVIQSGNLANGAWSPYNNIAAAAVVTANQTTSPDGTTTAARIVFPAVSGGGSSVIQQFNTYSAGIYAYSIWLKGAVGGEQLYLGFNVNGFISSPRLTLTTVWQRFFIIATAVAGTSGPNVGTDLRDTNQAATPAQTIYAWGAQVEPNFVSSYIPTTAATVTRAADALSYPIASVTGFSTTQGSLAHEYIMEGTPLSYNGPIAFVGADPNVDFILLDQGDAQGTSVARTINGTSVSVGGTGVGAANWSPSLTVFRDVLQRGAMSWAINQNINAAHNAILHNFISVGPPASLPVIVKLALSGPVIYQYSMSQWARRTRYWPRQLSQAELINETAYDSPTATLSCGPMLADGVVTDTTNNSMNVRRHVQVPIRTAVRNIVVAIPGSFFNPEENPIPTPLTIAAATIEYPAGVFYKLYVGGSASLTVVPGATMARFDPLAITIPAGAEFWVKLFIQWTPGSIKLQNNTQWEIIGNWTNRGIGLTDQTRSTTVLASSPATSLFGNLVVFAICTTAQPCVAFMGDSIMVSGYDQGDPRTGAITLGKALREQIPFTNVSIGGDSCLAYLRGHACRDMFMYDPVKNYPLITHIVITLGVNEIGAGAVELQKNITTVTSIWRNRGVQVIGWTVTPQTSSTDIWATRTGQTVSNVVVEAQRIQYNAWLRTNYASIGMMRIIDAAHIVDPTDSGLWNVDGNAGWWGLLVPIMSGRTISSVNRANYNGNTADGRDYPASQTKSCMIYPMPGDTGTGGGAVSVTFSAGGQLPATATVTAGGDYDYPPMIVIPSSWVGDGLHANGRAFQEIIYRSGISPDWFTL